MYSMNGIRGNSEMHFDFNEDPIDFDVPPIHLCETVCNFSDRQKNDIMSRGITIKKGRFTQSEDTIILKNFNEFSEKYGISDPVDLFGIGRYGSDPQISKFLKVKHFYVRLAKDLSDRSLQSVYKRARIILHPERNESKIDKEGVQTMKTLHSTVGNRWNLIGNVLGKSGETCSQTFRWHDKAISKGKWTAEEEQSLIKAIKLVSNSSDISCLNIKNISWKKVASYISTRNFSQCRMYWANYLAWNSHEVKKKWNKTYYRELIGILTRDWDVEDASMIDWKKVHESFRDVAPSHIFLQKRFLYLKSRVSGYKCMSYKDIMKNLCKKYKLELPCN